MKKNNENFLDYVPKKNPKFADRIESLSKEALDTVEKGAWFRDEKGIVTLLIENRGIMNSAAQKLLKKPRVSQIQLEEFGSFIWQAVDGEKTVFRIGEEVKEQFGEAAEPLYERLVTYMRNLAANEFITFN